MYPIDPSGARELLEGIIAAFSVLGGGMAFLSGLRANLALSEGKPPEILAHSINEGVAIGFEAFSPLAIVALIITIWS